MFTRTRRFLSSESCLPFGLRLTRNCKKVFVGSKQFHRRNDPSRSRETDRKLLRFSLVFWAGGNFFQFLLESLVWDDFVDNIFQSLKMFDLFVTKQNIILRETSFIRLSTFQLPLSTFPILFTTSVLRRLAVNYTWKLASEKIPSFKFSRFEREPTRHLAPWSNVVSQRCCAISILSFTPARFFNRISRITAVSVKYSPLIRRGLFAKEWLMNYKFFTRCLVFPPRTTR